MEKGDTGLSGKLQTGFLGVIALAVLLFMLAQAQFLLITLIIAIIIFSLTSDAISAFARLKVPNWLATTLALIVITIGLLWATTTLVAQVNQIVSTTISYAERVEAALPQLIEWMGPQAQSALDTFVRNFNVAGWVRSIAAQASNLLSAAVMILMFVGFMFAERAWFPQKIERLVGDPVRAAKVNAVIASIKGRVNHYLIVKTVVSAATAALVWMIFRAAGLELAGPVAMLTFVLNFIPNIGSIVASVIAILLVMVQTGSVAETVVVGLAYSAVQFIIGNIVEPMFLGQTLRMSSFGIVLSLAFWGAVWGIPGMFLAVPIMVAVMIICAQIPWLRPVAVILSREGLADEGMTDDMLTDHLPQPVHQSDTGTETRLNAGQ